MDNPQTRANPTAEMLAEILKRYKELPAGRSNRFNAHVDGSLVYWMVVRIVQSGGWEFTQVLARQFEMGKGGEERITQTVEALSNIDVFPIETALAEDGRDIVRIPRPDLAALKEAIKLAAPEHAPPETIRSASGAGTEPEITTTRLLFDEFRGKPILPRLTLIDHLEQVLNASGSNHFFRRMVRPRTQEPVALTIITPVGQVILYPSRGSEDSGYFADRMDVLDARDMTQTLRADDLSTEIFMPILISLGFTRAAEQSALNNDPHVALVPLWAFLKLIACLQVHDDESKALEAWDSIYNTPQIAYDGHVTEFIKTHCS